MSQVAPYGVLAGYNASMQGSANGPVVLSRQPARYSGDQVAFVGAGMALAGAALGAGLYHLWKPAASSGTSAALTEQLSQLTSHSRIVAPPRKSDHLLAPWSEEVLFAEERPAGQVNVAKILLANISGSFESSPGRSKAEVLNRLHRSLFFAANGELPAQIPRDIAGAAVKHGVAPADLHDPAAEQQAFRAASARAQKGLLDRHFGTWKTVFEDAEKRGIGAEARDYARRYYERFFKAHALEGVHEHAQRVAARMNFFIDRL